MMTDSLRRTVRLSAGLLALCALGLAAGPARTVILVRHAERAGGMTPDAPLSEAGRCRAGVLSAMLADAGVTRIYTSEAARTEQTAAPLAKRLGLRPEIVAASDVDGLVAKLGGGAPEGVTLVVGHANTVPEIIRRLGGGTVPPIGDSEYDRMSVVTITGPNQVSVLTLRFAGCGQKP